MEDLAVHFAQQVSSLKTSLPFRSHAALVEDEAALDLLGAIHETMSGLEGRVSKRIWLENFIEPRSLCTTRWKIFLSS